MLDPLFLQSQSTLTFFLSGGIFFWLLVTCSVVLLAIIIFQYFALHINCIFPLPLQRVTNCYLDDEITADELQIKMQKFNRTIAGAIGSFLLAEKTTLSTHELEKTFITIAEEKITLLTGRISIIDTISTIAPLIGLLGTASGLVSIFNSLDLTDPNQALLTTGIAKALSTTILGLAITIPAVIAANHFQRKIDNLATFLQTQFNLVITKISNNNY